MARREEGAYPDGSVTDEQRRQRAVSEKTLRAAGLLPVARVDSAVSALQGGNRQKVGRFSDSPRPTPTLQAFIAHRILNILGHLMGHPFDFGPKTSLGSPTVHWKPRHPHPVDFFLSSYRKPRCISSSKWTTATTSAGRETDSGWRVAHDNVLQMSTLGNIRGGGHMFHLYW
jgi:hypothetical protein